MTVTFRLRLARPGAVRGTGNPSYSGVTSCPAAVRVASGGCSAEIGRVRAIVSSFRSLRTRRESLGQLPRPCGSWPRGGDEGLSLAAAAPGHARWSPALSLPRRCRAGHHARRAQQRSRRRGRAHDRPGVTGVIAGAGFQCVTRRGIPEDMISYKDDNGA
jgi:hypothetical protein